MRLHNILIFHVTSWSGSNLLPKSCSGLTIWQRLTVFHCHPHRFALTSGKNAEVLSAIERLSKAMLLWLYAAHCCALWMFLARTFNPSLAFMCFSQVALNIENIEHRSPEVDGCWYVTGGGPEEQQHCSQMCLKFEVFWSILFPMVIWSAQVHMICHICCFFDTIIKKYAYTEKGLCFTVVHQRKFMEIHSCAAWFTAIATAICDQFCCAQRSPRKALHPAC